MDQRSPVHEIVHVLWSALTELRVDASPSFVEHAAFAIHGALSAPGREYHNHDHVIEIAQSDDPLEVIAALYHDAVYIQVDRGVPHSMANELARVFDEVDDVIGSPARRPNTASTSAVTGLAPAEGSTRQPSSVGSSTLAISAAIELGGPRSTWM